MNLVKSTFVKTIYLISWIGFDSWLGCIRQDIRWKPLVGDHWMIWIGSDFLWSGSEQKSPHAVTILEGFGGKGPDWLTILGSGTKRGIRKCHTWNMFEKHACALAHFIAFVESKSRVCLGALYCICCMEITRVPWRIILHLLHAITRVPWRIILHFLHANHACAFVACKALTVSTSE